MAKRPSPQDLSRRERQIMDIVYEFGSVTAADVQERLPDPPSYSAVRAMLRVLEEKGHLSHRRDGPRYVFDPVLPRSVAQRTALKRVLRTFFDGSTEKAVAALLDVTANDLDERELDRLAELIDAARKAGR